jgi:hypothetical protein
LKIGGISFLSLDPSELEMQLFHHGTILGGSCSDPVKHLIAILASDSEAKLIQIPPKFIKDLKLKTNSTDEFFLSLSSEEEFVTLKTPKTEFIYKNIIPLPNLLTKTFLELDLKDPINVAMNFLKIIITHDEFLEFDIKLEDTVQEMETSNSTEENSSTTIEQIILSKQEAEKFLPNFIHIIQFCHLCAKGTFPPI